MKLVAGSLVHPPKHKQGDTMLKHIATLVGLAGCLALTTPVVGHACEDKNNPPIVVRKGSDGTAVVSAEVVRACEGEMLSWVFSGPDGEEMAIRFSSDENSPFEWRERKGRKVEGKVRTGAAANDTETEYPYDVSIEGVASDPKIIIER
jgi:hypothetical protein